MARSRLRLETFLPYRLSYTANLVSELIAGAYETLFGITIPEWRVLAHVAEHDGISQQRICESARMDKVSISRAAIALVRRGLVRRESNPLDGRSQLLFLSGAGRHLYGLVAPKALELERELFGTFTKVEEKLLVDLLGRIERAAHFALEAGAVETADSHETE